MKAFRGKRKVKINYYSFSSDEVTNRVIEIYQFHENSIIAYCNLRKDKRTFRIKNINKVALLDENYKIPRGWKPESIILSK
ncbi:MAG: WYL domain-containing protein [Nanoarchaeota archaeon]